MSDGVALYAVRSKRAHFILINDRLSPLTIILSLNAASKYLRARFTFTRVTSWRATTPRDTTPDFERKPTRTRFPRVKFIS